MRKYTLNLTNIKTDSHEKYYWLGFLAGDGNVAKNEARVRVELKDIDREQLENLQAFFESNAPITERTNNTGCHALTVSINSAELKRYLAQYNIVPAKTSIFSIPFENIPNEYIYDFARGLLDADGSIHIREDRNNIPSLSFVSQTEICAKQMLEILGFDNKVSPCGTSAYQIHKEGAAVVQILNKIYEHSTETSRLRRKYEIYKALNGAIY